mmetsp:Transcript_110750/g.345153  ORF Transcript_110750/g.345153 Transcript_110750/m.345153 type:complete len:270 (-) Transcript_110750:190-999(-)
MAAKGASRARAGTRRPAGRRLPEFGARPARASPPAPPQPRFAPCGGRLRRPGAARRGWGTGEGDGGARRRGGQRATGRGGEGVKERGGRAGAPFQGGPAASAAPSVATPSTRRRTERSCSAASCTSSEAGKALCAFTAKPSPPRYWTRARTASAPAACASSLQARACKPDEGCCLAARTTSSSAPNSTSLSGVGLRMCRASAAVSRTVAERECASMAWTTSSSPSCSRIACWGSLEQLRFRKARQPASCTTGSWCWPRMLLRTTAMPPS